jgi:fructose-1,6-bisphosphatase/inositol monophosphatase family enzyme
VRDAAGLSDAFFACDLGLEDGRGKRLLAALHDLFPGVQAMRLTGSTALGLAYVAAGRFDVYVHPSPYAWDFAPGVLLVQEAGGVVTQMDGGPVTLASRSIVAAAPRAHDETVERFRAVVAPGPA